MIFTSLIFLAPLPSNSRPTQTLRRWRGEQPFLAILRASAKSSAPGGGSSPKNCGFDWLVTRAPMPGFLGKQALNDMDGLNPNTDMPVTVNSFCALLLRG